MTAPEGRLEGKVVLISGGARGMGAAHARLMAAAGARIVAGDILDDEGKALADELGEAATYVHLDVRQPDDWAAAVATAVEHYGQIDVLVNNAGIVHLAPMVTTTVEDFRLVSDVNQLGVFLGMQAVIPPMTAARRGSIINISSVAGLMGPAGHIAYAASKWAVRGMTKVAAAELAPFGIRVNSVHPGLIDTPMLHEYERLGVDVARDLTPRVPLGRLADPEDVSRLVVFLASDDSAYSTGSEFVVDGGMVAGTPRQ